MLVIALRHVSVKLKNYLLTYICERLYLMTHYARWTSTAPSNQSHCSRWFWSAAAATTGEKILTGRGFEISAGWRRWVNLVEVVTRSTRASYLCSPCLTWRSRRRNRSTRSTTPSWRVTFSRSWKKFKNWCQRLPGWRWNFTGKNIASLNVN